MHCSSLRVYLLSFSEMQIVSLLARIGCKLCVLFTGQDSDADVKMKTQVCALLASLHGLLYTCGRNAMISAHLMEKVSWTILRT